MIMTTDTTVTIMTAVAITFTITVCGVIFVIYHLNVLLTDCLTVVPSSEVHPLTNEFDGRLGSIDFERWHIEIINEKDDRLTKRWTIHSLTPNIQANRTVNINDLKDLS